MVSICTLSPPSARWDADNSPETGGEMTLVGKTTFKRNVSKADIRINQTSLRGVNALSDQILMGRHARGFSKGASKVFAGQAR